MERRWATITFAVCMLFLLGVGAYGASEAFGSHFTRSPMAWYAGSGAKCIHDHEAGWQKGSRYTEWDATLGVRQPVYAGGFQGDDSFLKTYGRRYWNYYGEPRFRYLGHQVWVWVNAWPKRAQIVMAWRAWKLRGWGPWPTRRYCGL